jgi:hypothetical protein
MHNFSFDNLINPSERFELERKARELLENWLENSPVYLASASALKYLCGLS